MLTWRSDPRQRRGFQWRPQCLKPNKSDPTKNKWIKTLWGESFFPQFGKQSEIFRENIKNGDEPPKNDWISFSARSESACGGKIFRFCVTRLGRLSPLPVPLKDASVNPVEASLYRRLKPVQRRQPLWRKPVVDGAPCKDTWPAGPRLRVSSSR